MVLVAKKEYPPNYSHFGTVCIPLLSGNSHARHHTTVLLRNWDRDSRIQVFYGRERIDSLSIEDALNLKRGLKDPYIDAHGRFHSSGYNQLNGRVKRR